MSQESVQARAIFIDAVENVSPDRWREYVDEACGDDATLRDKVQRLLDAHGAIGSFMGKPAAAPVATVDQPPLEQPGTQIGPYKLHQQIGQGGMGTVFLAEQYEPVRRMVALKLIKPGMESRQVIARFDAERQALSLMDHPNIAKVLDAGTTDQGRPYFVMELVKGQPITTYCDQHLLTPRQRLELFVSACHAIQHAHQKGVIHRDIKPSNVMVAEYDDRPVCKVIDFGVAKALNQPLTEQSMFTGLGQILGTLEYMSPEQAKVNQLDIDTRSDVYSLGVLLYELLTGTTPFNKQRLGSAAWDEILRIIREEEPPMPSTRLSDSHDSLASISASRHTEPAKLTKLVRGELDWIVMKALEKDRSRRYETANGLAMDIQRYLVDEPVQACPPSTAYRFRKFVRKHKAVIAATVATFLLLVLGTTGLAISNTLIRREQSRTQAALTDANEQRDRAVAAERNTQARTDELTLVSDFQASMLEQVDATEAGRLLTADMQAKFEAALIKASVSEAERTARVEKFTTELKNVNATDAARDLIHRTILEPAVATIDKQFSDQPLVDAQLRQVLANLYRELGLYDAALPLQERALATRRRILGDEHPDTLSSTSDMGMLAYYQGKLSEAEPYFRETLEKQRRVLGDEHPDTLSSISNVGSLLQAQGKLSEAEPYFHETLEVARRVLGDEHPDTLNSISNMGSLLQDQGKLTEAELHFREVLDKRRRVLGDEDPGTIASLGYMVGLLRSQGKLNEAEPYCREALETSRRVLGEEHPDTVAAINNFGVLLSLQGKLSEAEPYFQESLDKCRRVLGDEHPNTLRAIIAVGSLLRDQGRLDEAEPYYREVLEKSRRILGEDHPDTLSITNAIGALLYDLGKRNEAEQFLRDAVDRNRRVRGAQHPETLVSIKNLGLALSNRGKLEEAETCFREAVDTSRRVLGDEHPTTLSSIDAMGSLLQLEGKCDQAEPYFQEALATRRRSLGENHPLTLISINNLGGLFQTQGKLSEAEPLCREALKKLRLVLGEEHPLSLCAICNLGALLTAQGKLNEAEPYLREALEKNRRILGEEHPQTLNSIGNLGALLRDQGKFSEAEYCLREALEKYRRVLGEEHPQTLNCMIVLGSILQAQGKHTEAVGLLLPIEVISRESFVADNASRVGRLLMTLGKARMNLHEFAAAESNLLEADSIFRITRGPAHKDTLESSQATIDLYTAWHAAEPDKGYDAKAAEWKAKLDAGSQTSTGPIAETKK